MIVPPSEIANTVTEGQSESPGGSSQQTSEEQTRQEQGLEHRGHTL